MSNMIKQIKYNSVPAGNSNEVFSLCCVWMATITTFPFWSDERGDVYDADQHQIGDGIGKPLEADEDLNAYTLLQVETYNQVVSLLTY